MAGYVDGLKKGRDGLWRYRIVVNGEVYTGCTNEVEHRLAVIWLSIKRGEFAKIACGEKPRKMITLTKALEIWEQEVKTEVTDRYINLCKQAMNDHFAPLLNRPLDTIDNDDIAQLLKTYQSKHYDSKYPKRYGGRNQLLTYWRSVKRVMISKKILTHWDLPKDLKGQKVPKRLIPQEHQDAIMAIIDNRFGIVHGVAFRLGLFIGLRSIEVNRATWRCVDWTRKKWVNFQTKGLESMELPIPPQLMEALIRLRDHRGGKVDPKDEVKAFEWFQKSPDFSASYLGLAYWEGRITKRDLQKARHYLLDASKRGRIGSDGLSALATMYRKGLGVTKDPVLAARFSPLIVDEPAKPPAAPKVRKPWAGDLNSVVNIQGLLQQDSPASSWLEYGKALMRVTRISSAAIALARASELGSAEAEFMLGQLYTGDWGISPGDDIHVMEPLKLDPAKGKALLDSASRKGVRPAQPSDSEEVQPTNEAQHGAAKYGGQDPRRLYFLFQVWNSKEGC